MAKSQILTFGLDDGPSSSVTQYLSVSGCGEVATWTSTESETPLAIPTDGTICNAWIKRSAAPGVGASSIYYLRKNLANSSMSLSFGSTDTLKESFVKVDVAPGDLVNWSHVPTLSPASAEAWGCAEFRPDNPDEAIMMGSTADVSLGIGARYLCLHAPMGPTATLFDAETLITNVHSGVFATITKLTVVLSVAPTGVTASRTFEIYKNGVGTGMTLTITGSSTSGSTTGSIDVSDGDRIVLYATANNAPSTSAVYYGIAYEPRFTGEYLLPGVAVGTLPTTGGSYEYNRVNTGNSSWTTIKQNRSRMGATWEHYLVGLGLRVSRAPDTTDPASSNKAYELFIESPSSQGLRAYVLDNATYANSGEMNVGAKRFGNWNVRALAYNTPASANAQWCLQMRYLENIQTRGVN